jgi:hypothetical protein
MVDVLVGGDSNCMVASVCLDVFNAQASRRCCMCGESRWMKLECFSQNEGEDDHHDVLIMKDLQEVKVKWPRIHHQ